MADQQTLTPAAARSAMRRHLRTSSQSPTRHRVSDELLSRLSPTSAVEALRAPSGSLKVCLDQASASEHAFAMRTAVASKKIHDWLDEALDWSWPVEGGPAGFVMPPAKRRRLFEPETPASNDRDPAFYGSLPASEFKRYEKRVDEILRDMDDLDLEEIKNQVLHNHIIPLSRPGSPFSDAGRSVTSTASFYTKMEDLTAVITAITVQALPNLARLSRLLKLWSARLIVLRKVPPLHAMITDAEVALQSGWSIFNQTQDPDESVDSVTEKQLLSRQEFDVIRLVIQQKVAAPGRELDYMLDSLEGMEDTLPDEWLDRMEAIERNYIEWATAGERRVREGEWTGYRASVRPTPEPKEPETPRPKIKVSGPSPKKAFFSTSDRTGPEQSKFLGQLESIDANSASAEDASQGRGRPLHAQIDQPEQRTIKSKSQVTNLSQNASQEQESDSGIASEDSSFAYDDLSSNNLDTVQTPIDDFEDSSSLMMDSSPTTQRLHAQNDGSGDHGLNRQQDELSSPVLSEVDRNVVRLTPPEYFKPREGYLQEPTFDSEPEISILESVDEEEEEPELPPLPTARRMASQESLASTVIHGTSGNFLSQSDDVSYREESAEPELPRLRDPKNLISSDAPSPPSSTPEHIKSDPPEITFDYSAQSISAPEIDVTPPRSPLEPPETFDPDTSYDDSSQLDFESPTRRGTTAEDDHLRQQIKDILRSIPAAKIRLTTESTVNLNPPDLQLPPKPTGPRISDPYRRSASGLSSRTSTRASTPSFLLAPARQPRSRGNQETKTYLLSRSTGEPPIKLFIRCVGEHGERVMVRVGGGWADLGEYLKDYATHHSRRSKGEGKVEVRDVPTTGSRAGSSPPSRPGSALESPLSPLAVRKTRRSVGEDGSMARYPRTPLAGLHSAEIPSSGGSERSASRMSWTEGEDSTLGLAGPTPKKVSISEESMAWVESMKEKVRIASGESRAPPPDARPKPEGKKFGEIGTVGGTKRVFRKKN